MVGDGECRSWKVFRGWGVYYDSIGMVRATSACTRSHSACKIVTEKKIGMRWSGDFPLPLGPELSTGFGVEFCE
jgi:hypothetical protein